jgi:hypothetical protein
MRIGRFIEGPARVEGWKERRADSDSAIIAEAAYFVDMSVNTIPDIIPVDEDVYIN